MWNGKVTERVDRKKKPRAGEYLLIVDSMEMMKTRSFGEIPKMTARIAEVFWGDQKVGDEVGDVWFIHDQKLNGEYQRGDLLKYGRAIVEGLSADATDAEYVKSELTAMFAPGNQAQGVEVRVRSTEIQGEKGPMYNLDYSPVPGMLERVTANRQRLQDWKQGRGLGATHQAPAAAAPTGGAPAAAAPAQTAAPARSLLAGIPK